MLERLPIREDCVLGVDLGIGSCGTALVQFGAEPRILFMGSRCFEVPEFAKDKELKNKTRRSARLMRRTLRRRRQRMAAIRKLFVEDGILPPGTADEFHHRKDAPDPWCCRAEGLDRTLTREEFAVAILHIAKHRGFKSTRKNDTGENAPKDNQGMLKAIAANKELSAKYRTIGEMMATDARFAAKKRNSSGDYSHTMSRDLLEHEVGVLFDRQRRLGNDWASETLEKTFRDIAFFQRPVNDSEDMVGECPLEAQHGRKEMRAARHAPSFELFRLLTKLNNLTVRHNDGRRTRLSREQVQAVAADFGQQKSLTYVTLLTILGLRKKASFDGVDPKKEKNDVCASAGAAAGTYALRNCLGDAAWTTLWQTPEKLDRAAQVLAFRDDLTNIEKGLGEIGLDPAAAKALMDGARRGDFGHFQKAGHISAKAARAMIPHLLDGKGYSDAAALAGYDHARRPDVALEDIRNAVVARALREGRAQVWAVLREFGFRPGAIVVELARDVGKGPEERKDIQDGIEKRTAERKKNRDEFAALVPEEFANRLPSDAELTKYELWKEQGHQCAYTQTHVDVRDLVDSRNSVQVDHILPRSRSQDNSYTNRVVCLTKANQDKKGRTPYEWFGKSDPERWEKFEIWVRTLRIKGFKKRNLLLREFDADRQEKFVNRNLNDTRYATRALLGILAPLYDKADGRRRLFARPGGITAMLRKSWGLEVLKKDANGKRIADDRHHGIDALVAACCTDSLQQLLTKVYQQEEARGREGFTPRIEPPWETFRADALAAYDKVFVSRSERRRARGQGHDDTIRQVREENGEQVVYERKPISKLTLADLPRVKDAERNRALVDALQTWIEKGKPADAPPRSPKGDVVTKVRVRSNTKSGIKVRGGFADNTSMVRVDVFSKDGKFYLVPVYSNQIMDKAEFPVPPTAAIAAHEIEDNWIPITASFEFAMSVFPDSYLEVTKSDGQVVEGYYRGTDRQSGAFDLSVQTSSTLKIRGIGARTLRSIRKFTVDRLGRKYPVGREKRTWHGEVCT